MDDAILISVVTAFAVLLSLTVLIWMCYEWYYTRKGLSFTWKDRAGALLFAVVFPTVTGFILGCM